MIIHGDCLIEMRKMEADSISSIVTDPPYGLSFMGKEWDHDVPNREYWEECLRITKPGGYLLAMGGTRKFHRLTCAIEDAGWEIRDCLFWVHSQGFPKSHNFGCKCTGDAVPYNHENTSAMPTDSQAGGRGACEKCGKLKDFKGFGTSLKPAYEPIIMAMKPCDGTFAQNVEKWGQAGINIDGCRIETFDNRSRINHAEPGFCGGWGAKNTENHPKGRWPANLILDEEAGKMLDEQSGFSYSPNGTTHRKYGAYKMSEGRNHRPCHDTEEKIEGRAGFGDTGGASRFFYCAKASSSERGGSNKHPTVKPLKLMEYLITLVMPPKDGILLDPFAGSGTTILAAKRLGYKAIGIEMNEDYCTIANKRLEGFLI